MKKFELKPARLPAMLLAAVFVFYCAAQGMGMVAKQRGTIANAFWDASGKTEPALYDRLTREYDANILLSDEYENLYGLAQKTMQKREVGNFEVVKDASGILFRGEGGGQMTLEAAKTYQPEDYAYLEAFNEYCVAQGIPFIAVMSPTRWQEGFTVLPAGVESEELANHQAMRAVLEAHGLDVLDLNEQARLDGVPLEDLFFRTDHHWTIETAFWAHGALLRHIENNTDVDIPNIEYTTNPDNYQFTRYQNYFTGTIGKTAGWTYSGREDFTVIEPAYKTEMALVLPDTEEVKWGEFGEVLLFKEHLRKGAANYGKRYSVYLDGDDALRQIYNKNGKGKLLVVNNSFGLPFTCFLSLGFEQVTALDLRHYREMSVQEYLEANPHDVVVCLNQYDNPRLMPG